MKQITREEILFRTHNFGELIPGVTELSEKQKKRIDELKNREKPLTDNMFIELGQLLETEKKFANPELGETAKKIVLRMFNEMIRGTYYFKVTTKQMEKGNKCENLAIARIAKVNGWGVFLNANAQGIELRDKIGIFHPDAYKPNILGFDAKCPWEDETFMAHFFAKELKDKNYIWQAKRGAMMADFDEWHICYSLENAPESIIQDEARKLWRIGENEGQVSDSFLDEVRQMHNYDHLPDWARVKTFTIKLEEKDRQTAAKYAEIGRDYFMTIYEDYKLKEKKIKL